MKISDQISNLSVRIQIGITGRNEFFLINTNRTFLAFLYKIDIKGIQNQQKIKLPPLGITGYNTNYLWITMLIPYPLSQSVIPCQSQIFRPL